MRASVSVSISMAGETASTSQSRTEDGLVGVTPTAPHAHTGTLTTRTSATEGVITTTATDLITSDKAVITWVAANGDLKHRYNVNCDNVAAFVVTFSGGAGDDLPAAASSVVIGLQVLANLSFDFDDIDVFVVSCNVRGVVAFLDGTDTEKCVVDMDEDGLALWMRDSGFPEPMTGTIVTHILFGSGDTTSTTSFTPKVLGLYDATDPGGSGQ